MAYPEADLTGIDYDALLDEVDAIAGAVAGGAAEGPVREAHADFVERHPHLFAMACRPDFDRSHLVAAMGLLKDVQGGRISKRAADEEFGTRMFKAFGPKKAKTG